MKKMGIVIFCLAVALTLSIDYQTWGKEKCTAIQDGTLVYPYYHYLAGEFFTTGFDEFGYNYQAHTFRGNTFNHYAGTWGLPPYEGDDDAYYQRLFDEGFATSIEDAQDFMLGFYAWPWRFEKGTVQWSDAWKSNKDCNDDGYLDGVPFQPPECDSGAWYKAEITGTYFRVDGKKCSYTYKAKFAAVPCDAHLVEYSPGYGEWFTPDGKLIGYDISMAFGDPTFGDMAMIEEIMWDRCGYMGYPPHYMFPSEAGRGLGKW